MNWTWNVRSRDGAMNGLEFARATTAGGFERVLTLPRPHASVEVTTEDGTPVLEPISSTVKTTTRP